MKSVICVYDGMDGQHSVRLTIGKIYEVIQMISQDIVFIKDDVGDEATYVMISGDKVWFEDTTPYIREDKLNELGI
jgi:hypothetical protein